jgi:hypothetical protein
MKLIFTGDHDDTKINNQSGFALAIECDLAGG